MEAEPATATAPFRPAMLKALDAEASVTPCSAAAPPSETNGVCRAPGRVSEAWISSAITMTPYRSASDAIAAEVGRAEHPPGRVVRVAEQVAARARGERRLEPGEVEFPAAVRPGQRHLHDLPAARRRCARRTAGTPAC